MVATRKERTPSRRAQEAKANSTAPRPALAAASGVKKSPFTRRRDNARSKGKDVARIAGLTLDTAEDLLNATAPPNSAAPTTPALSVKLCLSEKSYQFRGRDEHVAKLKATIENLKSKAKQDKAEHKEELRRVKNKQKAELRDTKTELKKFKIAFKKMRHASDGLSTN